MLSETASYLTKVPLFWLTLPGGWLRRGVMTWMTIERPLGQDRPRRGVQAFRPEIDDPHTIAQEEHDDRLVQRPGRTLGRMRDQTLLRTRD